ncbi:retropepsin-like aspartic protease [Crocosphaera watsonii]|uniref:Peptidase A2A, retrovirus n=1 Tax=Crocosphaera watsonii WH 0401 TaxID=555881 RepID=T2J783_CROWT|nr:retropepsin-like aspartic protease [Crocosphaera watsonii]CCQ60869.1 Peptidase A2A, retrovirus [Crocosphaera watsonii WH 0401]
MGDVAISFDAQELLNLPTRGESLRGSGITGNSQYMVQNLDRLEIGSIVFSDIEILIGQLPKPFSRYQIDGILGGDILKNLTLILNYPEKRLRIEKQIVSC